MTYHEYQAKINEMVANPDKIATMSVDLLAEIQKDTSLIDTMHANAAEHEKKIRELQDSNYQMFLRMTGDQSTLSGTKTEPDVDPMADVMNAIFGEKEEK